MKRLGTFIALLRGINVGGHNRVPMSDLRAIATGLGWSDVRTYIQSGNLVFRSAASKDRIESALEEAIERRFRLQIPVIARSAEDWATYAKADPFPRARQKQPKFILLGLSKKPPAFRAVLALQERALQGEQIISSGDALWIHFAEGVARSKLTPALLDRVVGSPVTLRNWLTVTKLDELAHQR
jgi:uncharacterized protein (DUF1697 family)